MVATTLDRLNGINGGIAIKAPCRAATTANITLSGEQTIDGIAVVADDRILVKRQTNGVENGIYDVSTGSWSRSLDFDGNRDVVTGTTVIVTAGTLNAGTLWRISTTGAIVIDTTSIAFTSAVYGGVVLGSGTAAAPSLSFSGSASTGLYSPAANQLAVSAGGYEVMNFVSAASSVNYLEVSASATGVAPSITAKGTDTNIVIQYVAKGTGSHNFLGNGGATQFYIGSTLAAVNQLNVAGATAGNAPVFSVVGSDSDIGITYTAKGTGVHTFNNSIVGTLVGSATTVTTNANLTGVITSVGNATSIASQTGTGTKFVVDNTPTIISQVISTGLTASGSASNDFSASTGTFKTSTGANQLSGAVTISDATTPSLTTAAGKTNTGFLQINGKTSGALKVISADAAAQTVTLSLAAQTVGAATLTIPNMANVNKTVAWLESPVFTGTPNIAAATGTSVALTALSSINAATNGTLPASITGAVFQYAGADTTSPILQIDSFAGSPSIVGRRADGTSASPTAVTTDDNLLLMAAYGYYVTGGPAYSNTSKANFSTRAAEPWTSTTQGTYFAWTTTAIGGTTTNEKMRLSDVGNLKIGASTARGTTEGTNQIILFNGTAPAGTLSNGASVYSSGGQAYAMDSLGVVSLLTAQKSNPAISATKSANFTVLTYTPPAAAGQYFVSGVITTTSSTNTGTVQLTLDYVDSQGTTHTADVLPLVDAAGAVAATKTGASKEFHAVPYTITINNSATAIVLKAVITGTVSYTVTGFVEQIA